MTNSIDAQEKRKKCWPYLLSFFLLVVLGSGIGAYCKTELVFRASVLEG